MSQNPQTSSKTTILQILPKFEINASATTAHCQLFYSRHSLKTVKFIATNLISPILAPE